MKGRIAELAEPIAQRFGLFLLLLTLILVMWWFGALGAVLLDDTLHHHYEWPTTLPGVELVIVPLAAIAAARWQFAADWLTSLRATGLGPSLALLMAMTLVGLFAFLVWSWASPLTTFGPVPEFGVLRWLGTGLGVAFAMVWLPLFPRVTATLAGMIVGPALFALVGYTLGADMRIDSGSGRPGEEAAVLSILVMLVWILGARWLSQGRRPLFHAAWSGTVMLFLTALGIALW